MEHACCAEPAVRAHARCRCRTLSLLPRSWLSVPVEQADDLHTGGRCTYTNISYGSAGWTKMGHSQAANLGGLAHRDMQNDVEEGKNRAGQRQQGAE